MRGLFVFRGRLILAMASFNVRRGTDTGRLKGHAATLRPVLAFALFSASKTDMSVGKINIHRLKTGVPGLDEVLGGGLPEFSFNLIAGKPGCGKTTLAYQIMFALATPERPALYFTVLGEPPIKMLRYQLQFDFFDLDKVNRAIRFINLSHDAATGDLDKVLAHIASEVQARGPGVVFIDSFRSMTLASQGESNSLARLQTFIQDLSVLMTSWQATTFLIGEYFSETDPNPIFTVADGLIWLRQCGQGNLMVRKMEVMKMRGQPTLPGQHTFRISGAGMEVFAPPQFDARVDAGVATPSPERRLSMGIAQLDKMLGGGLPRGYSLLVVGPSGAGKSILAAAFLAEGAHRGETGVIAAFKHRHTAACGPEMAELIKSGRVGVVDTRASTLSVNEITRLLISEIRRLKASRIVIDSLSGFELALAQPFRDEYRESLSRLLAALARTGATVLMTSELEDRFSDLRFSPYGTAFMTDAIILQRYIELDSRLQRVMAVVKVRASAHSNELRLFTIDDDGIQIGEVLRDDDDLSGGHLTWRQRRQALVRINGQES
jgi:circadian clock protein KaiC